MQAAYTFKIFAKTQYYRIENYLYYKVNFYAVTILSCLINKYVGNLYAVNILTCVKNKHR